MDLSPTITYEILHLNWETDTHPHESPFVWKMPVRATFLPIDIHTASVAWRDAHLGFLSPAQMEKQFAGRDLVLRGIQYVVSLQAEGKLWQQRFSHEFMGTDKLSTKLLKDGKTIVNPAILFEPFEAHEVFDNVVPKARRVQVMQFVS